MSNLLPHILQRWVYLEKLVTADQLADWAEVKTATMYKYIEGERDLPFRRARRIARQMSILYGRNDIAASLLGTGFDVAHRDAGTANGQIDDELGDLFEATADLRRAFLAGDPEALRAAIRRQKAIIAREEAEGRLL